MTPGEFRDIVRTMKEFGVTKVRMSGVEIDLQAPLSLPASSGFIQTYNSSPAYQKTPITNLTGGDPVTTDPIKHKLEQVESLMKLTDNDLVEKLFPENMDETA